MEAIGFAFGAAGALGQVLECFELDNARLRLSRWGSSVDMKSAPRKDQDHAEQALQQIYGVFKRTEELSAEFAKKNHIATDDAENHSLVEAQGFEKVKHALHEKMRDLSLKRERQPSNSTVKKVKWAIYSKEHMKSLIENLATLTTELVELFPEAKDAQKRLCDVEMLDFLDSIRVLKDAIGEQDIILAEALKKLLEPTELRIKYQNNLSDHAKIGGIVDSISGSTVTFS